MDETEQERKERKRMKKEKKREREEEEAGAEPSKDEIAEKLRKAEKKAAKKARKEKEEEAESAPAASDEKEEKLSKKDRKARDAPKPFVPPPSTHTVPTDVAVQVYPEEASAQYPAFTSFDDFYSVIEKKDKAQNSGGAIRTMKNYISEKAFPKPSPIQSHCWPALFSGKDLVGIASTGSGKTLAFLFPALFRLEQMKAAGKFRADKKPSPKILVVAPTRELAMQSYQVCIDVGIVSSICVYGGMSKHGQLNDMRRLNQTHSGLDIVIATPGRLLDFIQEDSISLSQTFYLVLDEADRMLDEGFEPAIRQIIGQCPGKDQRQTAMLSATWPEEIRALANNYLKDDTVRVVVGSEELAANHKVTQTVEVIENNPRLKDTKLFGLLDKYHKNTKAKCLIFVLYKVEAVKLEQTLKGRGYNVGAIHGNKTQVDRTDALAQFRSGEVPLLIATDVAARGLDIPNVEYVINYSFPLTVEDYVHRIGRTGRGGKSGVSHTFFTDFDKGLAGGLVGVLQEAGQEVPQEIYRFPMLTKKKESKLYGAFGPKDGMAGKKATKITFD
jgi:ATP-dependent RNA helicase DBP3